MKTKTANSSGPTASRSRDETSRLSLESFPRGGPWGWLCSLVLFGLLAWGVTAFTLETTRAFRTTTPPTAPPSRWTLRSPAVAELRAFARRIDDSLEPGRRVVLSTDLPWGEDFFLSLWHAYVLPRHDVVRGVHPWARSSADHLITHPGPLPSLPPDRVPRRPATLLTSYEGPAYSAHFYRLRTP